MNVKIEKVDNNSAGEWNQIINESSHGTIFHNWDWLTIAGKHSGFTLHPLVGYAGGNPVGVIPLFQRNVFGINMVLSPPPHVAIIYLGPVLMLDTINLQSKRENIYVSFLDAVNSYIQELRAKYVNICLPPKLSDPRPFTWSGYTVKPDYNYDIDLSMGADKLFQSLPKNKRGDINRALKRGMTVELGGKDELKTVYDLMVDRYNQQGRTVQVPLDYLSEIYDAFSMNLKVFISKYEGEIISGSIDVLYKDTLFCWIGNPKPRKKISPSPNELIQWEEIQYCCERGILSYVTMGTAGNERLRKYYSSKFNPNLDVRFSAKKCSSFAGCVESAYNTIYKPVVEVLHR